jgi:hypothetical protein
LVHMGIIGHRRKLCKNYVLQADSGCAEKASSS